jgi:pentatricopeptide repeat protein
MSVALPLVVTKLPTISNPQYTSQEIPPSPEVATFTVFFMAFTAMVGKELLLLDYDADAPGKTILSTYVPTGSVDTASETVATDEESSRGGVSEDEKEGVAEMKATRPEMGAMLDDIKDDADMTGDSRSQVAEDKGAMSAKDVSSDKGNGADLAPEETYPDSASNSSEPRRRFTDSLSALQIEEAKATGRAQLGLAFEMLTMMKKRALRADPEAYQCLIDACGRVGDTKRATDLLAKMHEDGIVADGTVYACLVSAFSAETAWKKGTKEEDLPGKSDRFRSYK